MRNAISSDGSAWRGDCGMLLRHLAEAPAAR